MKTNKTIQPLLLVEDMVVEYAPRQKRKVRAVASVSFTINRGETFGLVGESGCGKSSIAKATMQLPPPTSGQVVLEGVNLTEKSPRQLRPLRNQFQMIFQDPVSSLNPRSQIRNSVAATLRSFHSMSPEQRDEQVRQMLVDVGIDYDQHGASLPFQLSGGQCQRVSIARALICKPKLLVCDEPVSSLDVSIQAQIINLLQDLKTRYGLSMLFISHDLTVVKNICDRIAVMYLGKFCELATTERLYRQPAHPYTRALLNAIPGTTPLEGGDEASLLPGESPAASDPPTGCRFHPRCPRAEPSCQREEPMMRTIGEDHAVACHHPLLGHEDNGPP